MDKEQSDDVPLEEQTPPVEVQYKQDEVNEEVPSNERQGRVFNKLTEEYSLFRNIGRREEDFLIYTE